MEVDQKEKKEKEGRKDVAHYNLDENKIDDLESFDDSSKLK